MKIGFVTDYYNLLEDQSRLYHYLATFELDHKRKLAMETKRVELLQPLLPLLSLTAFEAIHKQVPHSETNLESYKLLSIIFIYYD